MDELIHQHPFQQFANQTQHSFENSQIFFNFQENYGFNSNIVLFCCWVAVTGRGRLSKKQIHQLIAGVALWHEQVVLGLHKMKCTILKQAPKHFKELRDSIAQEEENASSFEQRILADTLSELVAKPRGLKQQLLHTLKNIATYAGELRVYFDMRDCQQLAELLNTIFPKIHHKTILAQCQTALLNRASFRSPRQQTRLRLT